MMVEEKTSPRRGNGVWRTLEQKLDGRSEVLEKINRFIETRETELNQAHENGGKLRELKDHLDDLREQQVLYKRHLNTLELALEVRGRGVVTTGSRSHDEIILEEEAELDKLARKIKEKFGKYKKIKPLS